MRRLCSLQADISNSKAGGGLGIRNLKAINESLVLSAAWRLAQNPVPCA